MRGQNSTKINAWHEIWIWEIISEDLRDLIKLLDYVINRLTAIYTVAIHMMSIGSRHTVDLSEHCMLCTAYYEPRSSKQGLAEYGIWNAQMDVKSIVHSRSTLHHQYN